MTAPTPYELLADLDRRRTKAHDRLAMYTKSRNAYFGIKSNDGVIAMDSQGRSQLRLSLEELRDDIDRTKRVPNLIQPIVDDYVALKGVLPTMRVLPRDDTSKAREEAGRFSRVLRSQWDNSAMDVQAYTLAWYLSCLGDGIITLNCLFPEHSHPLRPPGIYLAVVDPSTAFPRFKASFEREELDDLIIVDRMPSENVASTFNLDPATLPDEITEVIYYLGTHSNMTVVNGEVIERVDHNLGFCPAQWIKNKPNTQPAQSDIYYAIEPHRELQSMLVVMNDALIEATYAPIVIKDPVNVSKRFEVGPGAEPIVVQATGNVTRLAPGAQPQTAGVLFESMLNLVRQMAGTSPIRTEMAISGSNISGKAIHAQQGPMETRLAAWQTWTGWHYQRINSKILWMLYALPAFRDTEMSIWGTSKGKPYNILFRGAELNGWTRNEVIWSAIIGSTAHERVVVGLQLLGNQLVPGEWVLDQLGVNDSELLLQQAKEEAAEKLAAARAAESGGTPPVAPHTTEPGGPMPAAEAATALEKGATPGGESPYAPQPQPTSPTPPAGAAGQAPTIPGFPPVATSPSTTAWGTPLPVPDEQAIITRLLATIAGQLRGEITFVTPTPDGLRIGVTDRADKELIRTTLAPTFGRITFQLTEPLANAR